MNLQGTEQIHKALKSAAATLRKSAALHKASASGVAKKAAAEKPATPALDAARVRDAYEDLAAMGLTKTAEIEGAVEAAVKDPNVLLGALHKAAAYIVAAQDERVETTSPGKLVQKRASTRTDAISAKTQEVRQRLERLEAGR